MIKTIFMRHLFLGMFLLCSFYSRATIHTVNNNPAGLAQFSNLQTAVNAASHGDTIYVHGSVSSYGNTEVVDKRLTFIGPGTNPDKATSLTAMVNFLAFYNLNTSNCDGSVVMGLHFTQELRLSWTGSGNAGYPVNGVKVIRNRFYNSNLILFTGNGYGSVHMYDLYVEGNYFENSGVLPASPGHYFTNITIMNNVFIRNNGFSGSSFIGSFNNSTNVVVDHNVFALSPSLGSDSKRLFNGPINLVTFKNNIFQRVDNLQTSTSGITEITNCSFQHNLTYDCATNTPWNYGNNINLGGNIANQNPLFADQTAIDAGNFTPNINYSIASGPANNAGTDSKDLGVLFDETSTMNWAYGRNSRLPYIHSMNVMNSTVPAGGVLNVQINARKAK